MRMWTHDNTSQSHKTSLWSRVKLNMQVCIFTEDILLIIHFSCRYLNLFVIEVIQNKQKSIVLYYFNTAILGYGYLLHCLTGN